jgi:hypothetical protein
MLGVIVRNAFVVHERTTTPEQLADASLEGKPDDVARRLNVNVTEAGVRAYFSRSNGRDWAYVSLAWEDGSLARMTIVPREALKAVVLNHAREVLTRRFHAHVWERGAVKVEVQNDELSFHVVRASNPIAARQVDVARQVLLEAAFDFPVRASSEELTEVLGGGEPL